MSELKQSPKLLALEIAAALVYTASVVLFAWLIFIPAWICSIAGSALCCLFFYKKRLYSDFVEQGVYVPLSVLGLLNVVVYSDKITQPTVLRIVVEALLIGAITIVLYKLSFKYKRVPVMPKLDAITTAASFVATAALICGFSENWYFWVLIDLAAVFIYLKSKAYVMGLVYVGYAINAVIGIINWRMHI